MNEAWQNFLNATEESEQKKWTASVVNALEKLNMCTEEVSTFVGEWKKKRRNFGMKLEKFNRITFVFQ